MLDVEKLSYREQMEFLARLSHNLTICARSTYKPGTEEILEPTVLRAYNELIHRVTAAVSDYVLGAGSQKTNGIPIKTVLEMLKDFGSHNKRVEEIKWVINFTESRGDPAAM